MFLSKHTGAQLKQVIAHRGGGGGDKRPAGTGSGNRDSVFVRCTSATAADTSGVGAQCYPGIIVDPQSDQTSQPTLGTVWLTVLTTGSSVGVPVNNQVYECLLTGRVEAAAGDVRPRAFGVPAAGATGRAPFAADLTEATGAASWQSRTIVSTAWANDTPTGTNNAYPVQCGGADFTAGATSTSIMWEEPPGSGVYAFLPIQYASVSVPGFVSTGTQSIAGSKTFTTGITLDYSGAFNVSRTLNFDFGGGGGLRNTIRGTNNGVEIICQSTSNKLLLFSGPYSINISGTVYDGVTGTFATGDGRTATVKGGIITSIV